MSWTPLTPDWTKQADRDIKRVTPKEKAQIVRAVELFAATGQGDVKVVVSTGELRLRVRDRRVFMLVVVVNSRLRILRVAKRGDAY